MSETPTPKPPRKMPDEYDVLTIKLTQKLKKEVEEPQTPRPAPVQPQGMFLTPKQLEEAQLSAIMSYEKIRKDRKKLKEEQKLIEKQKQEIKDKLTRPAGYGGHYTQQNRFYNCY